MASALQNFLEAWVPTPAGTVFVILAWGLALYALRLLSRCRGVLAEEGRRLAKLRQQPTGELRGYLEGAGRSTLAGKLISTMWAQRESKTPDLDAIQTMVSDAAASQLAFPRAVPNICLLLGLMGTVVGLAGLVRALAPGIQQAAR